MDAYDRANRAGPGCHVVLWIVAAVLIAILLFGVFMRLLKLILFIVLVLIVLAVLRYAFGVGKR